MTRYTFTVWNALWDIPRTDSWTNNPRPLFTHRKQLFMVFEVTARWVLFSIHQISSSSSGPYTPLSLSGFRVLVLLGLRSAHHGRGPYVKWFCTHSTQRHHWVNRAAEQFVLFCGFAWVMKEDTATDVYSDDPEIIVKASSFCFSLSSYICTAFFCSAHRQELDCTVRQMHLK